MRLIQSNLIVLISILCISVCAGCDGAYHYRYSGRIVAADLGDRQREVTVTVDDEPSEKTPRAAVGPDGRFDGAFWRLTGWVFALRPPAPTYDEVYLGQWEDGQLLRVQVVTVKEQPGNGTEGRELKLGDVQWE